MNDAELDQLKAHIQTRLAEITAENALGAEGQSVVTLDQQSVGRLSRMDALQNQAMAKAQQSRRDHERKHLLRALAALDTGEYGFCEDCGEDIPVPRLLLNPAATRCISCAAG